MFLLNKIQALYIEKNDYTSLINHHNSGDIPYCDN